MILQLHDISKHYGGLHVLSRVTFGVGEGQIVGLIGPNGAGKSTLFEVISGVRKPDSGRVVFRSTTITGLPPFAIARLGLARTHQVVRPLKELTVRENVMAGACYGREQLGLRAAGRVADEVMARVGLSERAEMLAGSLNVAQKKRLELARALAAKPYLVLLDEVLAGLNPNEVSGLIHVIREIRDAGLTILMVEHVMQAVMSLCDYLYVLDHGEQIAEGVPSEVAINPRVVEAYLGDPKLAAEFAGRNEDAAP